ncbi:MAG: response regulator [Chloroflexi bacterium]|nr:response regulator [Chloroflexota bacterium]
MPKLLVIEDESTVRETLVEILSLAGYETLAAANGEAGVELALAAPPDLIICDVAMPGLDGFGVLKRLQQVDKLADVPIIFLSGQADAKTIRLGMAQGADDFLTKPFSVPELLRVIKVRLDKRARRQSLLNKAIDELRLNITTALPHELRTAIMIIEGYTYLVLDDAQHIDPVQREMIESIQANAMRLRFMAEKYLWYLTTQMQVGRNSDRIMSDIGLLGANRARAVAERMHREDDLVSSLPMFNMFIQQDYFDKIIEEIVENAFKFSRPGTPVTISGCERPNSYTITVQNFGPEFTPEQIQQIGGFMQFNRQTYEQQGTGLGLVIARGLCDLAGGELKLASENGETTVTILLRVPRGQQ